MRDRGSIQRVIALAVLYALIVAIASESAIRFLLMDRAITRYTAIYTRTILSFNYFEGGFVRRGLGGTIAWLFGDVTEPRPALLFHVFSAALLAVPIVILIAKLANKASRREVLFYSLFILASPYLCRSWSPDLARLDMLVLAFIAWAVVAMVHARPYMAVAVLAAGSLVHETALIFGAPLIAALGFVAYQNGELTPRTAARSCAIFLISLILIGIALHFSDSPHKLAALASSVRERLPSYRLVDEALYVYLLGSSGIEAAICGNFLYAERYWLYLSAVVLIVVVHLIAFGAKTGSSLWLFCAAAIFPTIALSFVARDLGRWVCFGVFNAWLLALALTLMKPDSLRPLSREFWKRIAVIVLISLPGKEDVFSPSYAVDVAAQRLGIPVAHSTLDVCNPGWKEDLADALDSVRSGAATGRGSK